MAFSSDVKARAMVACARRCCICHKFCGNNMEVHHIVHQSQGGSDDFENAIPLCFDCHANVGQYNLKHPKGVKYSAKELKLHRDHWYQKVEQEVPSEFSEEKPNKISIDPVMLCHQEGYEHLQYTQVETGFDIMDYIDDNICALSYSTDTPKDREEGNEIGALVETIENVMWLCSMGEVSPSVRMNYAFDFSEHIERLKKRELIVFVAKEIQTIKGGIELTDSCFPVLQLRIIRDTEETGNKKATT